MIINHFMIKSNSRKEDNLEVILGIPKTYLHLILRKLKIVTKMKKVKLLVMSIKHKMYMMR